MRSFLHLRNTKAEKNDFICLYWDNGTKYQETDEDIRVNVKITIVSLGLEKHGITINQVGSQFLRSGGAMKLKVSGADPDDIKKIGRW